MDYPVRDGIGAHVGAEPGVPVLLAVLRAEDRGTRADRVEKVGVRTPAVDRRTQSALVLESGIATNTGSGKGQGPLWSY